MQRTALSRSLQSTSLLAGSAAIAALALAGCRGDVDSADSGRDGGEFDAVAEGRALFRYGTFGTEGYWSDAVGLGRGIVASEMTLRRALDLGLQIDSSALSLTAGGASDGKSLGFEDVLDDPAAFLDLVASDGVLGLVADDVDGDELIDLGGADTLGVSCALCHAVVDGSLFRDDVTGGAIGSRVDGPAPSKLDVASLFAVADNSRALLPFLPQSHATIGGFPISRTGAFADATSSEAEVDALLRDKDAFPLGTWDILPDGIGAPVTLPALYDIRRSSPYGVGAEYELPLNNVNAHLTYGLDPTSLLTTGGAVFLDRIAPGIGAEIRNEFEDVLSATGVMTPIGGFPYVNAQAQAFAGVAESPVGLRFEFLKLQYVGRHLAELEPMPAPIGDAALRARGAQVYEASCYSCHGDPTGFDMLQPTPMNELLVQFTPTTLLARGFPYSDVLDDTSTTYDNRLALFDRIFTPNQIPSAPRVIATPQLIGLHLRDALLHDASVPNLGSLINPARGVAAPHAIYVDSNSDRAALVEFLMTAE